MPAYSIERMNSEPVVGDRGLVVAERPGERVAEVDVPRLQRLVAEEPERDDEEHRQETEPGQRAACTASSRGVCEARRPLVLLPHSQPEIRFCHCVRYFWLFNAALSKRWTCESVSADGKISWLFATAGFSLSAACFAPITGGM